MGSKSQFCERPDLLVPLVGLLEPASSSYSEWLGYGPNRAAPFRRVWGSRHPRWDLLGSPQVSSGDSKGHIRDVVGEYALDGGQGTTKLDRCRGFVGLAAWSARLHMPGQSNALITCSVATASKASDQRDSGKSVASLSTCGPMLRSRCRAWPQVG